MATANEMRQQVEQGRAALASAIEAAAAKWETPPAGDEWSPRKVAEHAIGAERSFAGMVAQALGREAPAAQELSLASAAEATAALTAAASDCAAIAAAVSDANLNTAAAMEDGAPFPKTIEGVLQLTASHLDDHAQQISKA